MVCLIFVICLIHLLALGRAYDKIPSTNYIDGVDQTSFLLSDNGISNRNAVFMYSETSFMAVR